MIGASIDIYRTVRLAVLLATVFPRYRRVVHRAITATTTTTTTTTNIIISTNIVITIIVCTVTDVGTSDAIAIAGTINNIIRTTTTTTSNGRNIIIATANVIAVGICCPKRWIREVWISRNSCRCLLKKQRMYA